MDEHTDDGPEHWREALDAAHAWAVAAMRRCAALEREAQAVPPNWREQSRRNSRTIGEQGVALAAIREALGCEPGGEVEAASRLRTRAVGLEQHVRDSLGCEPGFEPGAVTDAGWATHDLREIREAFAAALPPRDIVAAVKRARADQVAMWRVQGALGQLRVALDDGGPELVAEAVQHASDAMERAETLGCITPQPGDVLRAEDFGKGEAGVLRLAALLAEAPEEASLTDCDGITWTLCQVVDHSADGLEWVAVIDGLELARSPLEIAECAPLTVIAWPEGGVE